MQSGLFTTLLPVKATIPKKCQETGFLAKSWLSNVNLDRNPVSQSRYKL